MLLFLFSPFFNVKATGNCTKNTVHTVYIFSLTVWNPLYYRYIVDLQTISNLRKLKGIYLLFTEHVSILTLGNFFLILRIPQLWWALFISTVILKSTYELWILFDIKQYVTACVNFTWQCARISIWLVMIDTCTCIFKELVILGNAW